MLMSTACTYYYLFVLRYVFLLCVSCAYTYIYTYISSSTPTVHRSIGRIHMSVAQHSYHGYLELIAIEKKQKQRQHDEHQKMMDMNEHDHKDGGFQQQQQMEVKREDLRTSTAALFPQTLNTSSTSASTPTTTTTNESTSLWQDDVPDIGIGRLHRLSSVPSVVKHVTEENRKKNLQYVR